MKKNYVRFGATVATMFLALNTVNATDLTEQIETSSSGLGNSIRFEKSYDTEKDLNKVFVKLLVDKTAINTVLNQKSGPGSDLSIFYFSIDPNLAANSYKKGIIWYGDGLQRKTYEEAISALDASISSEENTSDEVVWVNALSVQYYDKTTGTWKISDTKGDSNTTIKDDLLNKLGLDSEDKLVYGENYRFSMYDKYTQVWRWDMYDSNNNITGSELVSVDWVIEFPIAGKVDDRQVLFESLEDALESETKEIFINSNIVVEEDIVIPEDVTITISENATLTVSEGATLTIEENATLQIKEGANLENDGTILGEVKVNDTNKTYSIVEIAETENGKVSVTNTNAASGETVTITTTANKDYELDTLKVLNKSTGKEVEVKDNKFVMPESDVEIVATFKATAKVKNPETGDNIVLYIIAGLLSLGAIIVNSKLFKKIFN